MELNKTKDIYYLLVISAAFLKGFNYWKIKLIKMNIGGKKQVARKKWTLYQTEGSNIDKLVFSIFTGTLLKIVELYWPLSY